MRAYIWTLLRPRTGALRQRLLPPSLRDNFLRMIWPVTGGRCRRVISTAIPAAPTARPEHRTPAAAGPLLEPGDRLSRAEFERRYERMPHVKKAELIEGIVYMPSPVRVRKHGIPHNRLGTWLGHYVSETPGVECCDNSTVRLDLDNEPQPDLVLIKSAAKG